MLGALVRFALAQRLFVLLAAALLAGAGWLAFRDLPIDAFPDVSSTQVKIIMKAPGMTPEEVESRIAMPIEVEMLGIPKQRMLRSVSKYGLVDVTVDFERRHRHLLGAPAGRRAPRQHRRRPAARHHRRHGADHHAAGRDVHVHGRGARHVAGRAAQPARLGDPSGAALGARRGRRQRARRQGAQLRGACPTRSGSPRSACRRRSSRRRSRPTTATTAPAASAKAAKCCWCAARARIRTLDDLRAVVVAHDRGGRPARRRGAGARRQHHPLRRGDAGRQGRGGQGLVLGLAGANAQQVVEGVTRQARRDRPTACRAGVTLKVFYNRADLVTKAVGTVSKALLEATVLVLVLLGAFLGNLRAAVAVAVVLPLAALATFMLMRVRRHVGQPDEPGRPGHRAGHAASTPRWWWSRTSCGTSTARPGRASCRSVQLVLRAVREVAAPVASGMLIIVVVFLPLLTLQGLEGKFFVPVALTIVFALAQLAAAVADRHPGAVVVPARGSQRSASRGCRASCSRAYQPALAFALRRARRSCTPSPC